MTILESIDQAARELAACLAAVPAESAERLAEGIRRANRVFVAGAGRSGLMMRAFAMRLRHLGIEAYVVGETVTPGIARGDLLVVGSGSGETESLAAMAGKAAGIGADVALATVNPRSAIAEIAGIVVTIPAAAKEQANGAAAVTAQPMGTLFEQSLLLLLDGLVLELMREGGADSAAMLARHANLE